MRLIPVALFIMFLIVLTPIMALAQDPTAIDGIWSFLEGSLPAWVIIGLIVLRQVSEIVAKAIPDTATGGLATIRRIFKILALYIPNKG